MSADEFFLTAADGVSLHVYRWTPEGAPRAVVQIVHGLAEHGGRYGRLAQALTAAGYGVYAIDLRGHGETAKGGFLGYFARADGWDVCLSDLATLTLRIEADFPGTPIVFFGHSMGSLLGQQFIADHGDRLAGAVLSGSNGAPPAIARVGALIARFERLRLGGHGKSAILQAMLFGAFNKKFAPNRTDFDWLSRDEKEVDKYVADPLCGFPFTVQLAIDLVDALGGLTAPQNLARIRKDLPIYIFSGSADPVGENLTGLIEAYRKAGLTNVSSRVYPEARHETLNEINRDEVTADLIAWLDGVGAAKN